MSTEHELADATGRLAQTLDLLSERVARYRVSDLVLVYCNRSWAAQFDAAPEDLVGQPISRFLDPAEMRGLHSQLARLSPATPYLADTEVRPASREPGRWVEWADRYLDGPDGAHILAVGRDVTERKTAEDRLAESESRFRAMAELSSDLVFRLSLTPIPHLAYASPSMVRLTGWPPSDFADDLSVLFPQLDADGMAIVQAAVKGNQPPERFDLRVRRPDETWTVLELQVVGVPDGWQGIGRDVTQVRRLQDDLAVLALRDPLTGLANRRLLDILLESALARSVSLDARLLVTLLDLDDFKAVNDTHGHAAGDALLVEVARRLTGTIRGADVVARLGGDEFVTIHECEREGTTAVLARIAAALADPYPLPDGTEVVCEASVGSVLAVPPTSPAELLAQADAAMYRVKRTRREPDGLDADYARPS